MDIDAKKSHSLHFLPFFFPIPKFLYMGAAAAHMKNRGRGVNGFYLWNMQPINPWPYLQWQEDGLEVWKGEKEEKSE